MGVRPAQRFFVHKNKQKRSHTIFIFIVCQALMFCGFILTGELIFALGIQFKQYYVSLVGRFIFGLGGESLTVAQNNYTARWFDGPQLALAFGLVLSFARVGRAFSWISTYFSWRLAGAESFLLLTRRLVGQFCRYTLSGKCEHTICHLVWSRHLFHLLLRYA